MDLLTRIQNSKIVPVVVIKNLEDTEPMLRALMAKFGEAGELSFEERMGCGFGACMGCTCKTKGGHKRICREGPVLRAEEVE